MPFVKKRVEAVPGGFGTALRELRELRGYSREDVQRMTGIHISIVSAFEEERIEDLIDPSYEERHVRAIVAALEGRPAYFLEKYHGLLAELGRPPHAGVELKPRVRALDLFVGSRAVAFLGFLLVVALVAGYMAWQVRELSSIPALDVAIPTDGQILDEPSVRIEGVTDPAAIVTVNGERAVVEGDGAFRISLGIPRGVTTLRVEAKRRYGSVAVIERHVIYDRPASDAPTTTSSTIP